MKLRDLVHEKDLETRTEVALKSMDWSFDLDANDEPRLERGHKALREVEVLVGALYTAKPVLAQSLWETYCPYAQPGSLPPSVQRR